VAAMTEQPKPEGRARKPRPLPTVMAALAIFGVAFEFLAFQLSSGKDPAVGVGAGTPVTRTRPAKKIVITKVIPAGATVGGAASSSASAGSVPGPAPVTSSSS
jgi:hypothetical protein